jgi:hypothetical protein
MVLIVIGFAEFAIYVMRRENESFWVNHDYNPHRLVSPMSICHRGFFIIR